jgi:hypothetical protein
LQAADSWHFEPIPPCRQPRMLDLVHQSIDEMHAGRRLTLGR